MKVGDKQIINFQPRGRIIDRVKDSIRNLSRSWFGSNSSRSEVPAGQEINTTRGAATGVSRGANNFEMLENPSRYDTCNI